MRLAYPLAAAFAALVSFPVYSQDNYVSFGGGLNLAEFIRGYPSDARVADQSDRFGGAFHLGYQTVTGGENATLVYLGYESRGAVWSSGNADVDIKFNYIQAGFDYKALFGPASGARFYLSPGVGVGILVNSTAEARGDSQDLKNVSSFDIELAAALGFQVPLGRNAYFLEAGYGYGLLDTVDETSDFSANNSVIKFRVGFLLGV
jgi:hypothetical protein